MPQAQWTCLNTGVVILTRLCENTEGALLRENRPFPPMHKKKYISGAKMYLEAQINAPFYANLRSHTTSKCWRSKPLLVPLHVYIVRGEHRVARQALSMKRLLRTSTTRPPLNLHPRHHRLHKSIKQTPTKPRACATLGILVFLALLAWFQRGAARLSSKGGLTAEP